jgi:hypothetical protein
MKHVLVARPRNWRQLRLIPLAFGVLAMALGLWTGLARIGLALPQRSMSSLAEFHGGLMICGFLGTVISLERAVALGRGWAYAAPALASTGTLFLVAGMHPIAGMAFFLASAALLIASVRIIVHQPAAFTVALAIGAGSWSVGTLEWLMGYSMPVIVGWWLNFLILTIAAERLELSRMARPSPLSRITFAISVVLLLLGSARGELAESSDPVTAVGLLGCAVWLLHHDLARRTIHLPGQPRFIACSILAGHVWLGVSGVLLLIAPPGATAFSYDAAVHAITIGFVLSMILGHAPIILPALTGIHLRYTGFAYVPLFLLHASVILRVGSDFFEWLDLRAASAVVTILALVVYAACLAFASWKATPRAG